MQHGIHPIVQRIGGDAGSCIIFTEVSVNERGGVLDIFWPIIGAHSSDCSFRHLMARWGLLAVGGYLCLTSLAFDCFWIR